MSANSIRGEAALIIGQREHLLRPTFTALISAEDELGSLFALVERAASSQLKLAELAALFWHCLETKDDLSRSELNDAVAALGLHGCAKPLRIILGQIIQGSP